MIGTQNYSDRQRQAGFTLVELAIVMIIIGLLIGGILKGQELIANAQIAATVAQMKGVDAAASTFQDSYAALPGDMLTAAARLPNCTALPCNDNGDGSGRINEVVNGPTPTTALEGVTFWAHLNAADLVSGVKNSVLVTFGESLPSSPIGGGLVIGFQGDGAIAGRTATATARGGHYIVVRSNPAAAADATNGVMTPTQAARIDRKMDDGSPNGGTVMAIGSVGAASTNCASAATVAGTYNEGVDGQSCSIAVRIQQ